MCGGGGSAPEDNSAKAAQIQADADRQAREDQRLLDEQKLAQFNSNLTSAHNVGIDSARQYFSSQGLDPENYIGAITQSANAARSRVPQLDGSPGTYFEGLGAQTYNQLEEADRAKALRGIDTYAREGFDSNRITNNADDAFLASILEERRADADDYLRNLLDRQIITQSGYDAGIGDLEDQRVGANARLQDLGIAELERGRGNLRNIAGQARTAASQARLGDGFDPYSYQTNIDQEQADFFANLAGNLRSVTPDDLFDTDGLAGIAGAAQGAQNTAFDPSAISGIFADSEAEEDDEEEDSEDFLSF